MSIIMVTIINKKYIKCFFVLLLSMIVLEILNGIVYLFTYFTLNSIITKGFIPYITEESVDIICRITVAVFSIISYFFIGKKILGKYDDNKYKRNVLIVLAVTIALSYPLAAYFCIQIGLFYSIHWSMCSPVTYILLSPILLIEETIPLLYEILFTLLSPISVLLIWLFSKTKVNQESDGSLC